MKAYVPMVTNWWTAVEAAQDRAVMDRHVARELGGVGDHDLVAHVAVVGDVHVAS